MKLFPLFPFFVPWSLLLCEKKLLVLVGCVSETEKKVSTNKTCKKRHKSTRPLRKGEGPGWVGIVRLPVQACKHAQRGGCGGFWFEGAPCVAVRGRVFRVQKPRAGAPLALPPRLSPRSQNPILLPPLPRWEEEEEKKRRSLAHRNVGRAGSRGPHHTTPRRLDRHSGVLPPRYPLSLSVLYSPLPCPGFDLPRCLVLRFLRSRVFWLLRCWAPSRLPNTQKKFEQTMTTTLLRPQPKISKIEKTKFPNGNIGIFFSWPRARARERSTSLRAP